MKCHHLCTIAQKHLKIQERYQFIEQYLEATEDLSALIKFLGNSWPELFSDVLTSENMTSDHIRKLSVDSLYYLDDQALRNVNKDGKLRDYISSAPDYLAIEDPNIERLVSGFVLLKVAFSEIDYSVANESLFNAVYENGIYYIDIPGDNIAKDIQITASDNAGNRYTMVIKDVLVTTNVILRFYHDHYRKIGGIMDILGLFGLAVCKTVRRNRIVTF